MSHSNPAHDEGSSEHEAFHFRLANPHTMAHHDSPEWLDYYSKLSEDQKLAVWEEYYERFEHARSFGVPPSQSPLHRSPFHAPESASEPASEPAGSIIPTKPAAPTETAQAKTIQAMPTAPVMSADTPSPAPAVESAPPRVAQSDAATVPITPITPAAPITAVASLATPAASDQMPEVAAKSPERAPIFSHPGVAKRIGSVIVTHETAVVNSFFTLRGQLRSLGVGLACGLLVVSVFGFTLFNELVITPFIKPSQAVAQTVALDESGDPLDPSPKIRIPSINVEIPVVYGLTSTDEKQFQKALDEGVTHYPTTVLPGQAGNTAFFGHSSNNIFNPGKYKFAFVLLHQLQLNEKFYLTHDGKLYTYEVISRRVVKPTEVGVLGPVEGQVATATLITCDPPGTSTNRLIVVGKQISPDPSQAVTAPAAVQPAAAAPAAAENLPGKAPTLLDRIWSSIASRF